MLEKGLTGDALMWSFAKKTAKVMLGLSSSHVYFIVQQAYGESADWPEVVELLERIIADKEVTYAT